MSSFPVLTPLLPLAASTEQDTRTAADTVLHRTIALGLSCCSAPKVPRILFCKVRRGVCYLRAHRGCAAGTCGTSLGTIVQSSAHGARASEVLCSAL